MACLPPSCANDLSGWSSTLYSLIGSKERQFSLEAFENTFFIYLFILAISCLCYFWSSIGALGYCCYRSLV